MSDNTPDEPIKPIDDATTIQPVPEVPAPLASDASPQPVPAQPFPGDPIAPPPYAPQPDVLADVHHPVGSSYDPMPLQTSDAESRNWMGIVALIFGILGGTIIAIVFGILGLNAVKQGKATNKGMNIWGIVLGAVWAVIGIAAFVAFFIFAASVSDSVESAANAEPGDCYVSSLSTTGELVSANPTFGTCTGTENATVYFVTDYMGLSTPDTPGFIDELDALCRTDEAIAAVDLDKAEAYYVEYYVPYADTWDTDPHTVVCGLSTDGEPVDTSVVIP